MTIEKSSPPNDRQKLHARVLESVGRNALELIGAVVAWAHVRSYQIGGELYGSVGRERSGLLRWMQCDSYLLRLSAKIKHLMIRWVPNEGCAGKHIEIVADDVRLLIAHDQNADAYSPLSDYATTLVEPNQMSLFGSGEEPLVPAGNRFYTCVIFHSKSEDRGKPPQALQIRFPDGRGGYAVDHMDLLKMFPNLSNEVWLQNMSLEWAVIPLVSEEKVVDAAIPSVRKAKQVGS
jgi:hypothetical protein